MISWWEKGKDAKKGNTRLEQQLLLKRKPQCRHPYPFPLEYNPEQSRRSVFEREGKTPKFQIRN